MSSKLCLSVLPVLLLLFLIIFYLRSNDNLNKQLKIANANLQMEEAQENTMFVPTTSLIGRKKSPKNFEQDARKGKFESKNIIENDNLNENTNSPIGNKNIQNPDLVMSDDRNIMSNNHASWSSLKSGNEAKNEIVTSTKDGIVEDDQTESNKESLLLPGERQVEKESFDVAMKKLLNPTRNQQSSSDLWRSSVVTSSDFVLNTTKIGKHDSKNSDAIYKDRNLNNNQKVRIVNKQSALFLNEGKTTEKLSKSERPIDFDTTFTHSKYYSEKPEEYKNETHGKHENVELNSKEHHLDENFDLGLSRFNITEQVMKLQQDSDILYKEAFVDFSYLTFYREAKPKSKFKTRKFSVLLLHASKFSSLTWVAVGTMYNLAHLGFRTVAIDLPGFGRSKESKIPYSQQDILGYMVDLLIHMRFGSCALVAPSRAGDFAMPLVMHHPDMVQAFVAITPTYTSKFRTKTYKTIRVPTLVIFGENDGTQLHVASLDNLEHLADRKIYMIHNATHPCYIDRPRTFHKLLIRFLFKMEKKLVLQQLV